MTWNNKNFVKSVRHDHFFALKNEVQLTELRRQRHNGKDITCGMENKSITIES